MIWYGDNNTKVYSVANDCIYHNNIITPPRACLQVSLYCHIWVWFSNSLLWDRVYKSGSWGLEQGIIFQETDQLVEDLSLD